MLHYSPSQACEYNLGKTTNLEYINHNPSFEDQVHIIENKLVADPNAAPVLLAYLDCDMNYVRVNNAYALSEKKTPEYFPGKNFFSLHPNAEKESIFQHVVETGEAYFSKTKPFQGKQQWDWMVVPTWDNNGAISGLAVSIMDVTDRVKLVDELQRSERELKQLNETLEESVRIHSAEVNLQAQRNAMILSTTSDGFFVADMQGNIVDANPAFCTLLGYSEEEMLQMSIPDFEANENPQDVNAHMANIIATGHDRFDTRHRRKNGSLVDIEISTMLVNIGDEQLFYVFARDISARKEAESALTRARDEAQRASRAKSEFLARMSHELRTPMNAILGFAQLLQFEPLDEEPMEFTHEIRQAGGHLLELINELLDLSRIESGKLTVAVQPTILCSIVEDAVQIVIPSLAENHLSLDNLCATDLSVLVDPIRLKQILVNLLSNAVKYNRPEGCIKIESQMVSNNRVRIKVSDTGYGISKENLSLLFTPFERLGAEFGEIDGSGIGLALSKQLAELMDGILGVESNPGQGSTFWVELPIAQMQTPEENQAIAVQQMPDNYTHTVLYIEDNEANQRVIESLLRRKTHLNLLTASDGEQGLELARRHSPNLILVDIHLPGKDGYAVLFELKNDVNICNVPIIALSADAMPVDVQKGLDAGFAYYITKPINVDQLLSVVEHCLPSYTTK